VGRYLLTDAAKDDIREIVAYLRRQSPAAARQVRREFTSAMRRLADFPQIGHKRADLVDEPIRFWCVYSYLIVYRPETKPLEILRVLHAARDVGRILAPP
jgi:plasmid stabilization system protein ParE